MQNGLLCAKPGVRNESILKRSRMPSSSNRSMSNAGRPTVGGDTRDRLFHLMLLFPV